MRVSSRQDILNGSIVKQLLLFFFPVFLGLLFQQLYNTFDAVVVGKYIGKEALAAVGGSTSTLISLLVNFVVGLCSGATVIIAQQYGSRQFDSVKDSVRSGMFLGVILGALMTILGIVLAPTLLKMMLVPDDVLGYSVTYMRVYCIGFIPSMIYNMGASTLRAIGDSKRPLYFLIVACVINIVLDIAFVKWIPLGVFGVALSTIISEFVSAILVLIVLARTHDAYHFILKELGFEKDLLKRIVVIGLPMGLQSVLYSVSNLFIQTSVNSFGTNTIAAYTAFGKVDAIYWNMDAAFGTSTMTLVGQNFGAKKIDRVKKIIKDSMLLEGLFSIVICGVCYFFGKPILSIFTDDKEVLDIGLEMLRFMSLTWILFVPIEILSSSIRACGDSLIPMIMTAIGICVTRIVWLLCYDYKTVIEALYCYPISWIITDICFIVYYLVGNWLKRCIRKQQSYMHKAA